MVYNKYIKKNKFNHLILPTGYKGNLIKKYIRKNKFKLNIECIETGKNSNIGLELPKSLKVKTKNVFAFKWRRYI